MNGDQIANLAYLGLLGAAVAGWFFAQNSQSLGKTAQQAIIWVLIFVGVIAGVGLWSDIKGTVSPRASELSQGVIEIPKDVDGHYNITLMINDIPIDFTVDTGATQIVLSPIDAGRLGFSPDTLSFTGRAETANGTVYTAPVVLDEVFFGSITDLDVRARVNGADMNGSLLGMTYLNRFDNIEISNDIMIMRR